MANTRIKDLNNTATTVPSDAYVAIDGSANGTAKISRDNLRQDTADAIAAAPSTYNLAPLTSGSVDVDKGGTGSTSAAGARTNLGVNSIAQDAEANGNKIQGPSIRFDGSDDYVEFADHDAFSFSNETDDTPFSVGGFVKASDIASFRLAGKYGTSSSVREWIFMTDGSGKLNLIALDSSGNSPQLLQDSPIATDTWYHVFATYAGSGPNSSNAFSAAASGMKIYVNGKDISSECTATNSAGYNGMSNTAQPLWIGRGSTLYAKGEIRDVKLFNKELSASEVKALCLSGSLPESFEESVGGADGGIYTSDFSAGTDSWNSPWSTAVVAGNIDSIGGQNDNLRVTIDSSGASHNARKVVSGIVTGKKYKIEYDYYLPSSNANVTGWGVYNSGVYVSALANRTQDAWTRDSFVSDSLATTFDWYLYNGTSSSFTGNGSDVIYIRNVRVTQIGSVLDARAENYNQSANKLIDETANNFVGVGTGVTILSPRTHISAETLDLTNLPTSDSGLSVGEVYNDSGTLKIKV